MKLYKVWSLDRTKKSFISINEENTPSSMYTDLILQGKFIYLNKSAYIYVIEEIIKF